MKDDLVYELTFVKQADCFDEETEVIKIHASDLIYAFEKDNGKVDGIDIENISALVTEVRVFGYNEVIKKSILFCKITSSQETVCFGLDDPRMHNMRVEVYMEININDETFESEYIKKTNFQY